MISRQFSASSKNVATSMPAQASAGSAVVPSRRLPPEQIYSARGNPCLVENRVDSVPPHGEHCQDLDANSPVFHSTDQASTVASKIASSSSSWSAKRSSICF